MIIQFLTGCPATNTFHNYCYVFEEGSYTWQQANATCEDRGGRLPVITDMDVQGFVADLIEDNNHGDIWLAATKNYKIWFWITST